MAVKPLDDRVLVRQSEAEETTSGGIVLPDTAKEKPQRGTVVAVGPGKLLDSGERGKMSVKKGDEIFYGKFAGTEIRIDRQDYVILRESDVLAVIEEKSGGKTSRKASSKKSSKKKSKSKKKSRKS
jgi:chaperonin GroES